MKIQEAAEDFLSCRRIAVTGVSHAPKGHGSNAVYQRLRERGYEVFAVNPTVQTVEGAGQRCGSADDIGDAHGRRHLRRGRKAKCEHRIAYGAAEQRKAATIERADTRERRRVWMHRSVDAGSVSKEATTYGRERGMTVIDGGCPLMFGPTSDGAHKAMCWVLKLTGSVPRTV